MPEKPEDIPQDVWDKAAGVYFPSAHETRERAARAIISAVDREREEILNMIDGYGATWAAESIAKNIRNRGARA